MNRHEFENLTLPHLDAVHRMAMQLARHADDAADLVQETYLKALRAAKRFREQGGGVRPWLFKILHNVFYARIGKAKRSPIVVGELRETATDRPGRGEPEPAWDLTAMDREQVDERLADTTFGGQERGVPVAEFDRLIEPVGAYPGSRQFDELR